MSKNDLINKNKLTTAKEEVDNSLIGIDSDSDEVEIDEEYNIDDIYYEEEWTEIDKNENLNKNNAISKDQIEQYYELIEYGNLYFESNDINIYFSPSIKNKSYIKIKPKTSKDIIEDLKVEKINLDNFFGYKFTSNSSGGPYKSPRYFICVYLNTNKLGNNNYRYSNISIKTDSANIYTADYYNLSAFHISLNNNKGYIDLAINTMNIDISSNSGDANLYLVAGESICLSTSTSKTKIDIPCFIKDIKESNIYLTTYGGSIDLYLPDCNIKNISHNNINKINNKHINSEGIDVNIDASNSLGKINIE